MKGLNLATILGEAELRQIITTGCLTSVLTLGAITPSHAATLGVTDDPIIKIEIKNNPPPNGSKDYDGVWTFDVTNTETKISLKIVSGNNDKNTQQFKGVVYTYPLEKLPDGGYKFDGSSLGDPVKNPNWDLFMKGTYNPTKGSLKFDSVQSKKQTSPFTAYNYTFKMVPEPTSTLSFLALGTLGAASTLKRKLKPSQSTEKETTKVG
ncbi:PEP-CTERM sorting domain-containing protein [Microcystis aeruginosa]|uniref:PEP-CTERM protein-sorting domain-containing protein n=1 Tax=Microcystis aeruginosa PCC 9443 TaxID=1160281 RepID=I4G3M3_MICAE|nr:PEP-CTERM sorting domain-containing protein [Microcystis aeruginosa]CCI02534.1 exported hypothetical protein [Microcystis aeruginosa PCC 9443]